MSVAMLCSIPHNLKLTCHPDSQGNVVRGVSASVQAAAGGGIDLHFLLLADMDRINIPQPGADRRADRLWQHTCFEAFLAVEGETGYQEFNFAPSGEWAVYAFRAYRDPAHEQDGLSDLGPGISTNRLGSGLILEAHIRRERLPMMRADRELRLALSAVIEEQDGRLTYWAMRHPPGKPDFHHPTAFALSFDSNGSATMNAASHPGIE